MSSKRTIKFSEATMDELEMILRQVPYLTTDNLSNLLLWATEAPGVTLTIS